MGCCSSSPYNQRIYATSPDQLHSLVVPLPLPLGLDDADNDEYYENDDDNEDDVEKAEGRKSDNKQHSSSYYPYQIRLFGQVVRNNSNVIPDDLSALPNAFWNFDNSEECLYEGEIDQGTAFRCLRPYLFCCLLPPCWIWVASVGIGALLGYCNCDLMCCWIRKEYSTRSYIRIYSNRIEQNQPSIRIPFGCLGCGSWNSDYITVNPFDRGAFGFRPVRLSLGYLCCIYPIFGSSVARQRCECNGSLWPRLCSDRRGCWCDEWLCDVCFCSYRYTNLADAEEFAFAASIALQAYFEGRLLTKNDMVRCIHYWRSNLSEKTSPQERHRRVCCEDCFRINNPCTGVGCYQYCTHPSRHIPYTEKTKVTPELIQAYDTYELLRQKQIHHYKRFVVSSKMKTLCHLGGCRRCFGRRGVCFCTEDCTPQKCCSHHRGDPAPPFQYQDWEDDNDASKILEIVLGPPPNTVKYIRQHNDDTMDGR